jgi:uncharacterized protein
MSIDVSHALKNQGVSYPFCEELALGVISYDTGDLRTEGLTRVKGTLTAMDAKVLVRGEMKVTMQRVCDRCAEPYDRQYVMTFEETFTDQRGDDKDDDSLDAYPFANEQIDLQRMLQDCIVLQLPTASLCTQDCKGLCPVCGVNLNRASCNCGAKDQFGPFGVLAGLADRDKEE